MNSFHFSASSISSAHSSPAMLAFPLMVTTVNVWLSRLPKSAPGLTERSSDTQLIGKSRKFEKARPNVKDSSKAELTQAHKRIKTNSSAKAPVPVTMAQPALPCATALSRFETAALSIQNSSLLKSTQQVRDEELHQVLEPFFSKMLIELITDYAPELSFSPLEIRNGKVPFNNANKSILTAIYNIFICRQPGFGQLQNDIIENHSRDLLEPFFCSGIDTTSRLKSLRAIANNDQTELGRRQAELQVVTNFLPCSELEKRLETELNSNYQLNSLRTQPQVSWQELEELRAVNVKLLFDALSRFDPQFEKDRSRLGCLAGKEAHFDLEQAKKAFKKKHFPKIAAFEEQLPAWRKVLKGMKKGK